MKTMRVVHIGHVPLPPEHPDAGRLYSHPGRWVLNLAVAQKAQTAVDPVIITQVPGASGDFSCEIDGVPVRFIRVPGRLRSATLFQFDKRLLASRAQRESPDIVHAHGTEEAYGMAAQATGMPCVITLQGVFALINRELPPPFISRERVVEFLERRTLRRAKHVIAKSDYIASRVLELFPQLVIHRIPNTFDPGLLGLQPAKTPGSVCFVGMVTERKGLDLMAAAVRGMAHAGVMSEFHVVGNRGDGAADYDRRVLDDLRRTLGDRLILHGILPAFDAAKVVAGCEVLVAPSREEMFGNQLVEATLLGTFPIVAQGTALAENVARFGFGAVVPQEGTAALALALDEALASDGRAHRASAWPGAHKKLLAYMGPSAVAAAHEELYKKIRH